MVERFSKYPNVDVIKGVIPGVLDEKTPERIAFLHIDLNVAEAEVAALDILFDRVSDGGVVLLDDYGRGEQANLYYAHKKWFGARGYPILEIPTGQGLVIKRAT